jgi:hypothetical protein
VGHSRGSFSSSSIGLKLARACPAPILALRADLVLQKRYSATTFVPVLFDDLANPCRVHIKICGNSVLKLSIPEPNPDFYGIIKR